MFRAASEAMLTIAADPKHLGARIGITAVLHSWGSAMTHHPHVHMIVPGGGISLDGERWVSLPAGLLPARARALETVPTALPGEARRRPCRRPPEFFGDHGGLGEQRAFAAFLAPLRRKNWFVYAKPPFAGSEAVLAYLSRYTHRVANSNSRLIALDEAGVTFRCKDYRCNGRERYRTMTLDPGEFIRRFLLHVLPKGFHRIRHYGLLASAPQGQHRARSRTSRRTAAQGRMRRTGADAATPSDWRPPCPCCGGRMIIIETFECGGNGRRPPAAMDDGARHHDHKPLFTALHTPPRA